jgi:hypothetical protein
MDLKKSQYSNKVSFNLDVPIQFPDFVLTYKGRKDQPREEGYVQLAPVYKFEVSSLNEKKTVNWSSGTGLIGPSKFTINNKIYWIELQWSEELMQNLQQDELVITEKN